jgi:hypothetical protein
MKTILTAMFVFLSAAAFGQLGTAVVSPQVQPLVLPDHTLHAGPHAMGHEQPLVGGAADNYSFGHGERPLWEFGPVTEEPSLGEVARAYRKQKLTAKKAEIRLEKQGS